MDFRLALRALRRSPGFSIACILILAIGIGANTAMFSVIHSVLLRPLPYAHPEQLVDVWETNPIKGWTKATCAPANFLDWQRQTTVFSEMGAYMRLDNWYLSRSGEPQLVRGIMVTGNLLSLLGVNAAMGRTFLPEETWAGKSDVAVIGDGLWRGTFGGDAAILGRILQVNDKPYRVVGVMPAGFSFPEKGVQIWLPAGARPEEFATTRRPHFLHVIARLKPGATVAQARSEMTAIAGRLEQQYPGTNIKMGVGLSDLRDSVVEQSRLQLLVLFAAVGFVLLIVCANLANLLMSRAAGRVREISIRTALGATRRQLMGQLLTESLTLAFIGGAGGLLVTFLCRNLIRAAAPATLPRMDELAVNGSVIAFNAAITFATALLFGLLPALHSSRADLTQALKQRTQRGSSATGTRAALVVAEFALSLVLVIGAGLMMRSFLHLQNVNPGFEPENIVTMQLNAPSSRYKTEEGAAAYFDRTIQRVAALPGVRAAGGVSSLPLEGPQYTSDFTIDGRAPGEYGVEAFHNTITPSYFTAIGIPLRQGRFFTDADREGAPEVLLINETMKRRYFAHEDPIGKRIKFTKPAVPDAWRTIVGVVGDERQLGLSKESRAAIYQPYRQAFGRGMTLVVRSVADPQNLVDAIRARVRSVDAASSIVEIRTMRQVMSESVSQERFRSNLLLAFAMLALGLAALGIYGVLSYSVAQRTQEIGIRMALGSTAGEVLRLVITGGIRLAAIGAGVGLGAAFVMTRWIRSLLFETPPTDPVTFIGVTLVLLLVALVACYLPARRATRIDPMMALREE